MLDYLMDAAARMGISMSREQAEKFKLYHELLLSANRETNLTRVSDDMYEACDRNYLDCIAPVKLLADAKTLIDVGSGAGFPGVPIAIMRPDIRVTLLDSLLKRVEFLRRVTDELDINAVALHSRCEDAAKLTIHREAYDAATARAVSQLDVLSEWLLPFVRQGGLMLALKGPAAEEETKSALYAIRTLGGALEGIEDIEIPGRDWRHRIVVVRKTAPTPARFPRKAGIAEKRPLRGE